MSYRDYIASILKLGKMNFIDKIRDGHEQLKKRIHSFRIPLSPTGQRIMKVVYFSIPLISGYFIMDVSRSLMLYNQNIFIPYSKHHLCVGYSGR